MPSSERTYKTLAIRLDEELHARLSVLAQLDDITITDAIRQAIESYVEAKRSEGNLADRAAGALEEIEREASARRTAIQSLFGEAVESGDQPAPKGRSSRRNGGAGAAS